MALEEIFRRQFAELDRNQVQDQVIAAVLADPEAFRELRASARDTTPTLAADTPAKTEKRTHSAARRI